MRLYVANCTEHNQRIYYRLDFNMEGHPASQDGVLPKHQDIPRGRQAPIGGDLIHVSQVDSIRSQLEVFGLRDAAEMTRLTQFTPYIFSVDKPVTTKAMEYVRNYNKTMKHTEGAERREAAAIAASTVVDTEKFTVTIEQETESEFGGVPLAEGFVVDTAAPPDRSRGKR